MQHGVAAMTETREIDILLVEDSADDAELAARALRKRHIPHAGRVTIARDGEEALLLLARAPAAPKLVIVDLKMPKVGGLDVLRHVRNDAALCGTPVVVFTSSAEQADVAECYRLGANSYVVKPVDATTFACVVGDVAAYWVSLNERPQGTA
jgi:CheY-like chemotaxis protein